MRLVKIVMAGLVFALTSFSTFANTSEMANDTKIKLYTLYGTAAWAGINADVDISLVINGQLLIAKNHPSSIMGESYVEVDSSLNAQEISQAKFTWLTGGKKYQCTAQDMPLYVQDGPIFSGTTIHFSCV